MDNVKVRLSYDPTGRNSDNLIGSESHTLTPVNGFPYKIVTMEHGGFYTRSLRVYDASYKKLIPGTDYIVTYRYANISEQLGLNICSDVVFLDPARTGNVFLTAQMVGGDVAFSLTAIKDYADWFSRQPAGYKPKDNDFNGNEPLWKPGELDKERWKLDTFEPFNNEIYQLSRAIAGATGSYEQTFRDKVTADYNDFLDQFNDRLRLHIENKANPHQDTKEDVGLGQVENYGLADETAARAGTANNLYMTPLTTWLTVDEFALKPLGNHMRDFDNPHRTDPEKLQSPRKEVVNATAATKYLRNEQVADANLFTDGATNYGYSEYYKLARGNIPAANFVVGGANGLLAPQRLGRGSPTAKTILRSDGLWVSWDALIVERGAPPSPQILILAGVFGSQAAGHQAAISQGWAFTAPVGSMIFYKNSLSLLWGAGNGGYTNYHTVTNASYKSAAGWIQM